MSSTWTDERDAELRRLCEQGLSYGAIGSAMKLSRNAVLGRACRMGIRNGRLPGRPSQNGGRPRKARVAPVPVAPPPPPFPDPAPSERVKLVDLTGDSCRYPFGDPQADDFGFCGRQSLPGRSFCADHFRRVYVAGAAHQGRKAPGKSAATNDAEAA